jgi:hypothetical protein
MSTKTQPDIIELDPSEWLHLESGVQSGLCRKRDGKRCCIGIAAKYYGVEDEVLMPMATLTESVESGWSGEGTAEIRWPAPLQRVSLRLNNIYSLNDTGTFGNGSVTQVTGAELVQLLNTELERINADFRFKLKEGVTT